MEAQGLETAQTTSAAVQTENLQSSGGEDRATQCGTPVLCDALVQSSLSMTDQTVQTEESFLALVLSASRTAHEGPTLVSKPRWEDLQDDIVDSEEDDTARDLQQIPGHIDLEEELVQQDNIAFPDVHILSSGARDTGKSSEDNAAAASGLNVGIAPAGTHSHNRKGKGSASRVKSVRVLADVRSHSDLDIFLENLISTTATIIKSKAPRRHAEFRATRDQLATLHKKAPDDSEIGMIAKAALAKLNAC